MKTTPKIFAVLAVASLLVVLAAGCAFWAFGQIESAAQERKQAFIVIGQAEELLSAMKDAETGQRGFALTGDEMFLESYLNVRDHLIGRLGELRQLSRTDAARRHLDALHPLVQAKMVELARVIALRRNHDTAGVLAAVGGGEGKRLMDSIRFEVGGFVQLERVALEQHDAQFQSTMGQFFGLIVAASLLALLLALGFAYLIHREARHQLNQGVLLETKHLLDLQQATNRELVQANVTLQISEQKLAVTLHSIGDGVIATDAEGRVTLLNPVAEQLTGWPQGEALRRPVDEIFNIINQETRAPSTIPVRATLEHGTVQGLANHTVLIARDGAECSIADSCAPIRDREGAVVGAVLVFRDVTKEETARQALRDGGALVQAILNTVADGIITLQAADGVIERVNPAAERMFGYGTAELVGRGFGLLFPEFERGGRNHTLEHFLAGDGTLAAGAGREVAGRSKDGVLFPLEITVSEMTIGGLRYFTGVLRDLSARKRAEVAELKAGALQSAIFNSANFSSIATDAKGVIQIFNVGAERMLGYAADDVLNKITPADISDPGEVIERAKTLSAELATIITPGFEALVFKASRGIEDIYELTYIRKDGTRLPAVVSVTALRDAQSAIIGYLLIGTDNTARKEVEEERMKLDQRLRDQQFYTRSLIEANIDAIMTTDPAGIITDINRQMEALTGRTRDELIGAPFKNYFTDPARAEASIKRVLSERKVSDYELTALALDGKETIVSYNATTFYDRDRRLQGVFAAARDITERKRLDQVLREKNAELDQAGRLKDEFLANMSHELRTPLNAILGLSEALLEQVTGALNPRQVRSITTISTSGAHLLTLINDILDLSKVESGMLELNPETLDTREFCESCLLFVRTQAVQKDIAIAFEHEGCMAKFTADPKRLKQILVNLLTNAVKFTPQGGRIGLQVAAPEGGDVVQFTVWDTGIGIAPEDERKLFRAFSQVDSGLTRAQEGTGLGLVLVAKLVELHGGGVTLESKAGKGSRFIVRLPQGAVRPASRENRPAVPPDLRHCHRALVIEDDPTSGAILVKYLTELGLDSVVQVRGDDTIATVLRERPDVILLDVQLPGENGWIVLARLKQHPETRDIPVAMVTVLDEPGKSHSLGATAHFTKPVTRAQLAAFLQRETAGSVPPVPRIPAGGAIILLAEDNEANVQTIGGYLEDKGYAMHYACNGAVAVQLASELRPALILMDIQMPVMDGLAAILAIRTDATLQATPIVALTALAMPGDRERCLAAGATDYMSKPVSLKALAALVERLLPARPPGSSPFPA